MKRYSIRALGLMMVTIVGTASAGLERAQLVVRLDVDLIDVSHIIGTPALESVPIRTPYAKMNIVLKQIRSMQIGDDHETTSIDLQNGDKLKGVISLEPVKIETAFGTVKIGIEHIRSLRVALITGALTDALRRGLVLYYSFDRDEGAKVTDQSGHGNEGEVCGAKWCDNVGFGGAYAFNGSNARILINNSPSLDFGAGARTIGAWIKSGGASRDQQSIFIKGANPGYSLRLSPSPDRAIEYFKSAGNNYSFVTSSNTITDNAWHHILVVDQGDGRTDFYKDGVFLETIAKPNHNSDSTGKAAIGAWADASFAQGFNGVLDEVMVFNRALSADEIRQIYGFQSR
ncbi:MAG: LamG domain-containing protein [bacterium]